MSLFDALNRISEDVLTHLDTMRGSEATTEQVSVLPFLDALGFDTQNPNEVRRQFPILNWDAVDFAVLRDGAPIMVVEAKKAGENLSTKYWKQLFQYFNADKAQIGILTNGLEYRFYTDTITTNIMDREPFISMDLRALDKFSVADLESLTKSRFDPETSLRKIKISNLVETEFRQPSDEFVRYFAKQVHDGAVWQSVIIEYRSILKHCLGELVLREGARHRPLPKPEPVGPKIKKLDGETRMGKDIPVFGKYEGHRFEAVILRASLATGFNGASRCIQYKGKLTNGKEAMIAAIRTINPAFSPGKKHHGLGFWHFTDPADGAEHPLYIMSKHVIPDEALRKRVLDMS